MLDHNRGGDDEFKTEVGIGADSCGNGLQVNFVAQFWQEVVMLMLMVVVMLILMAVVMLMLMLMLMVMMLVTHMMGLVQTEVIATR